MGLLDALTNMSPAMQQGLLATGLGMLANNRGGVSTAQALGQGGLLGMNAYASANEQQRQAQQDQLKAAMMQQQMGQVDAETQMKQQQLAQAQRQFNMQQSLLEQTGFLPPGSSGTGAAPSMLAAPAAASAGDGSALAGAMAGAGQTTSAAPLPAPMAAAAPTQGMGGMQAGRQGPMGGIFAGLDDNQRAQAALSMVGLKDVAGVIAPDYETLPNGIQINKKTGQPTGQTFPITDSQGHAIQMVSNGQGGFDVAIPHGSLSAFTNFQTAAEAAKAGFNIREREMPDGSKTYVTDAQILQTPSMQSARSPQVAQAYNLGNEDFMKRSYTPALDAGDVATGNLAQIQAMRNLNPATGWGAEAAGKAASVLAAIGVPNAAKFAGTQQEFNNVALSKLQQNLALQKGPQTEGDARRAAATFASLGNTPQANKFILDYAESQALQQQRRADFYRDALPIAQRTGDLSEIDRRWRRIQGSIWDLPQMQQYQRQGQGQ